MMNIIRSGLCYIIAFLLVYLLAVSKNLRDGIRCYKERHTLKAIYQNASSVCGNTKYRIVTTLRKDTINANAAQPGIISVSSQWAILLLDEYNRNPIVRNAFNETIGHELTHKKAGRYPFVISLNKSDKKFICWTDEVFADHGGARKALNGNAELIHQVIQFKRIESEKYNPRSKKSENSTHPTWEQRERYLIDEETKQMRIFDRDLVLRIAEDTGCCNQKIIDRIWKHYETRLSCIEIG